MIGLREAFTKKYPKYEKIISDFGKCNEIENPNWDSITKLSLSRFVDYLEDNCAQSSVKTYCAMFKALLSLYSDEVELPKDFAKILSVKGCISQNIWLTEDEIELLIKYEPETVNERIVRNQFVIACASGARYSDLVKFTKDNIVDENIVYVSQKTKIKSSIPMSRVVYRFIDDLEFVQRNVCKNTANYTIRNICKKCGINQRTKLFRHGADQEGEKWEFVAFHTARRSFATNLYLRGVDLYSISKLMGHADMQMTVNYIVCPPKLSDKALEYFRSLN